MKANELLKLLNNLPESTLRKYAQDYAEYLSPIISNRHREYTEQDARILRLIVDMKSERVKPQDIEATISSLQAGNWERLPALTEADQSIIPAQSTVIALQADKSALQREIEVLREMLKAERADRDEIVARMHRAETLLELYQTGKLKPE